MASGWQEELKGFDLEKRFWARINRDGPVPTIQPELGPCWLWLGPLQPSGYGQIRIGTKNVRVHRLAYFLERGEVPSTELDVRHLCGNHSCVRGSHLQKGTLFHTSDDTVFANEASKNPITRSEWDADSLYDSSSSASLWIRIKNGEGKWRYERVNSKSEAENLPGRSICDTPLLRAKQHSPPKSNH